ncbi:MAG: SDR family NAD(P)-dependent oxidoreductase [Candidatus Thorarchaeota archaeon]
MEQKKIITIVGMGPGNGMGIARRFGKEGFTIAMISRNEGKLSKLKAELKKDEIKAYYFVGDASKEESLRNSFKQLKEKLGNTDVLIYNAARLKMRNVLEERFESLVTDFKVNVAGVLTAVQEVLPTMKANNEGTILVTGGHLGIEPHKEFASLSIGKGALINLVKTLAAELTPINIHVASVIICGLIKPEDEKYNPNAIAENYWKLYTQKKEDFEVEILY